MTSPSPLIFKAVSKRFQRKPDLAERLLALAGRPIDRRIVRAVDAVDLEIIQGEVLSLVGESGCGKSTLGRMASGIYAPTEGSILFKERPVNSLTREERLDYILKVQMIFQDPYASLNPRRRIRQILGDALKVHGLVPKQEISERIGQALEEVGLDRSYADRYPHEFSGGQRQRIGIARALAVMPEFLVCDEPVAALDVSIQAQVINLFMDLRDRHDLSYLFISHDLGLVRHISDRVAIMYLGRIVELAPTAELFAEPNHPYTRALIAEIPTVLRRKRLFQPIVGEIPSPLTPPSGCTFHPRCPLAKPICKEIAPSLKNIAPGRQAACHLNDQ